jgi:AraC-like DNA-binding protein
MDTSEQLIASGNLGTSRRMIMGILSQSALFELDSGQLRDIFTGAGLPARALEQLDFPISLQQELGICHELVRSLGAQRSPACTVFNAMNRTGIEMLGVLGMAMRHAPSAIEALKVCLTYPQLSGGHSRMLVRRREHELVFTFAMDRPKLRNTDVRDIDRLVNYCLTLDLVSSLRNIQDIFPATPKPLYIWLPFAQPDDWHSLQVALPCPVTFGAAEARVAFSAELDDIPLPHANPLLYRSYVSIAERQSQMLAEELSLSERVSRWLWAYSPPPGRRDIARLLHMSERNLTRKLAAENTSYSQLAVQVQLERAKNLLRDRALSVAEISDRLGYAEAAAFSRAFSQWTGTAPGRWRKEQMEKQG